MKTIIPWFEVYRLVSNLPKGNLYGVPRGGSIVAGLTGRAVECPEAADAIVDDIVDSGRTKEIWQKRFPDKPFVALMDKKDADGWVVFPWEKGVEDGAEENIVRLLQTIGEDPTREGLLDTPKRVIKAWGEMTAGYAQDPTKILKTGFSGEGYDQMIVSRNIEFYSTCEHHMLPFSGLAHVAYIPKDRVVGLSKMARLVECFSKRLQIQERMTKQIADAMKDVLQPLGVGVMVQAKHLCMSCRGVKKQQSDMITTCLHGVFKDPAVKSEFLNYIR